MASNMGGGFTPGGRYPGAPCPECRTEDVKKGQVRIWALEEVVRLVERLQRESEEMYQPPLDDASLETAKDSDMADEAYTNDSPDVTLKGNNSCDSETRALLEPRRPHPYDSHILHHDEHDGLQEQNQSQAGDEPITA